MSHPLSFVDRWLCQFLYQNSPLHTMQYNSIEFFILTLLHFVNRRGGGEDRCIHTLLGYSLRYFDDIFHIWCNYHHLIPTTNKRVPIVQCREDAMPFTRVLLVAILLLLSTLRPRWRVISLTLMMMDTRPCTGQPLRASCPWWSTLWDHTDLMWRPLTRLACIFCWWSDGFCDLSGHTCCMGSVDMDTCTWVV